MRSPVGWALLGLIIERPSYAYDLAERFRRRYGDALPVSNLRHFYTTIATLEEKGLVEEVPGTRQGRQPKPHYRATKSGMGEYVEWLVSHVCDERRRREVFVLTLAALVGEPEVLDDALERCEQAWLRAGSSTPISREREGQEQEPAATDNLIAEENRLAIGAKLEWVEYARRELRKLLRNRW